MAAALHIREFLEADRLAVIDLWMACDLVRPWNDPNKDIDRKLAHSPEGLLVGLFDDQIIGAVMVGYDGHRGWVNYLAAKPDARRAGIGRALMDAAESHLLALGCPKLNLQIRSSNTTVLDFYQRLDYSFDECLSMGKRLVPDD